MKSIIYLPGLGYDYFDISGFNYAERYMSSLDKMNADKNVKYDIEKKEFKYGAEFNFTSQVSSIYEYLDNIEEKKETYRIYEFYYADSLTEKFNQKNVLVKLMLIIFTLIGKSIILIRTFISSQFLNLKKRIESFYFFSIFCLIGVFGIILFPAIISSLISVVNQMLDPSSSGFDSIISRLDHWMLFSITITTITAFLATLIPNFRVFITRTATEFLCLDYYLSIGENKLEIIGKLESLVERVSEKNDYQSMELHGYSFGSIIVMDALFPFGNNPTFRIVNEVNNIVTIGCPHDFIRTYYPSYFSQRNTAKNSKLKIWYNIYSDIDILSSNFRKDDNHEDGVFEAGEVSMTVNNIYFNIINPASLNLLNHFAIIGFRAHKMFWGQGVDASNCLNIFIDKQTSKGRG